MLKILIGFIIGLLLPSPTREQIKLWCTKLWLLLPMNHDEAIERREAKRTKADASTEAAINNKRYRDREKAAQKEEKEQTGTPSDDE